MDTLDEMDGREVHLFIRESSVDFDRRVRDAVDRLHRRQHIAEH